MIGQYPKSWRLPEIDYQMPLDAGLVRTKFEAGNHRQRRRYNNMPTLLNVSFVIPKTQQFPWLAWWSRHGYKWFSMKVPSIKDDLSGSHCVEKSVRCVADIDIVPAGADYIRITTVLELDE